MACCIRFYSKDALAAYEVHPARLDVVDNVITPLVADTLICKVQTPWHILYRAHVVNPAPLRCDRNP